MKAYGVYNSECGEEGCETKMSTQSSVPLRRLGRSGLIVSRLCLGTLMFGARLSEAESKRMVDFAFERGVNFIDTADNYVSGRAEEITGRAIAKNRDRWVLATKVATPAPDPGPNRRGLSRKWIMEQVAASLKRLGTDYIDILYLHKEDILTPLEETVRALADLQRAGSIRYFGVSNYRAWRIARICEICDSENIDRPVASQPLYHCLVRKIETEELPACEHYGLGVFPFSPIARGVLTGKYADGAAPPEGSRAASPPTEGGDADEATRKRANTQAHKRMMDTEFHPDNLRAAAAIAQYARARGADPGAFAIAWALSNPLITGAIAGPRTQEQWESYFKAFDVEWTPEDEAFVDSVVAPGTTAIPNYIDPMYPVDGRRNIEFGRPGSGPLDTGFVPVKLK